MPEDIRELKTECRKCGALPLYIDFKLHKIYCDECWTEHKLEVS